MPGATEPFHQRCKVWLLPGEGLRRLLLLFCPGPSIRREENVVTVVFVSFHPRWRILQHSLQPQQGPVDLRLLVSGRAWDCITECPRKGEHGFACGCHQGKVEVSRDLFHVFLTKTLDQRCGHPEENAFATLVCHAKSCPQRLCCDDVAKSFDALGHVLFSHLERDPNESVHPSESHLLGTRPFPDRAA